MPKEPSGDAGGLVERGALHIKIKVRFPEELTDKMAVWAANALPP